MNIDERLNRYKTPLSKTTLMLTEHDVKQLIRDVLAEVKPKLIDYFETQPDSAGEYPKNRDAWRQSGHNKAVGEMEAKIKELGL